MTPTEDRKPEKKASDAIRDLGENARETASRAQQSTARATEGIRDYQLKVVAAAQENANAFFEYAQEAVEARSISDLIELSTAHTRRQVEMMSKQAQERWRPAPRTLPPGQLGRWLACSAAKVRR